MATASEGRWKDAGEGGGGDGLALLSGAQVAQVRLSTLWVSLGVASREKHPTTGAAGEGTQ